MLLSNNLRFWDVRFDIPHVHRWKNPDGTIQEHPTKKHIHACVAAPTIADAVEATLKEWPDATIWSVNNHGNECRILIAEQAAPAAERGERR